MLKEQQGGGATNKACLLSMASYLQAGGYYLYLPGGQAGTGLQHLLMACNDL